MPEGATISDNDDKNDLDVNDPHRALDIDLEADDDFYAPPKPSRTSKKFSEAKPVEPSQRRKKENESVLLMESEETKKKEKKKHK
jgi:AP-3 complex subunit delta-1